MNFNNSKLDTQIRNAIGKVKGDLTDDDLKKIIGIHIGNNDDSAVFIPWSSNTQAFQMKVPNLFLTPDMINDEDMKLFSHILSFHLVVKNLPINFLSFFPNLYELYLYSAIIKNWEFLDNLGGLNKLVLRKCGNNGDEIIRLIANLRKNQKVCSQPILDDVILKYIGITDLSPMQGILKWTELDLSHNEIEDLSPVEGSAPYYLRLKYNKITNVSALENCDSYLINIRHNKVNDISPIIRNKTKNHKFNCLFVGHNPISDDYMGQLRSYPWIENDFQ